MIASQKIDAFRGEIYFVSQNEAQALYIDAVEQFVKEVDAKYFTDQAIQNQKMIALDMLFNAMKQSDLVAMADTLLKYALPLLGE